MAQVSSQGDRISSRPSRGRAGGASLADGADLRVHPTCKAVLGISVQTQGQGPETTIAQIVAKDLGLSPEEVEVVPGDPDRPPLALGTSGPRSTPVSGAAAA